MCYSWCTSQLCYSSLTSTYWEQQRLAVSVRDPKVQPVVGFLSYFQNTVNLQDFLCQMFLFAELRPSWSCFTNFHNEPTIGQLNQRYYLLEGTNPTSRALDSENLDTSIESANYEYLMWVFALAATTASKSVHFGSTATPGCSVFEIDRWLRAVTATAHLPLTDCPAYSWSSYSDCRVVTAMNLTAIDYHFKNG